MEMISRSCRLQPEARVRIGPVTVPYLRHCLPSFPSRCRSGNQFASTLHNGNTTLPATEMARGRIFAPSRCTRCNRLPFRPRIPDKPFLYLHCLKTLILLMIITVVFTAISGHYVECGRVTGWVFHKISAVGFVSSWRAATGNQLKPVPPARRGNPPFHDERDLKSLMDEG